MCTQSFFWRNLSFINNIDQFFGFCFLPELMIGTSYVMELIFSFVPNANWCKGVYHLSYAAVLM